MNGITPFLIVLALSLAVLGWGAELAHAQSGANSTAPESATVTMTVSDGTWNSGETLGVTIRDSSMNRDPSAREEFAVSDPSFAIPSLEMGSPSTLESTALVTWTLDNGVSTVSENVPYNVTDFSKILVIRPGFNETAIDGLRGGTAGDGLIPVDAADSIAIRTGHAAPVQRDGVFYYLNYDLRSLGDDAVIHGLTDNNLGLRLISGDVEGAIPPSLVTGTYTITGMGGGVDQGGLESIRLDHGYPIVIDIFAFGQDNDQRYNDAIYRLEPEETGADTGVFEGTIKYVMLNQINVLKEGTYSNIAPITDNLVIVINGNHTGENSSRVIYPGSGADGTMMHVSDQQEIPTHSGIVSFDQSSYRPANTATITLVDQDLNTDSDAIDVYTVVDMPTIYTRADFNRGLIHSDIDSRLVPSVDDPRDLIGTIKEVAHDMVAEAGHGVYIAGLQKDAPRARLLDISFDNRTWACQSGGLSSTGFMLLETSAASGMFKASFQVPRTVCSSDGVSAIGLEMEANYLDFRDAVGDTVETGSSSSIEVSAGSVSFDRTVYPVPWGGRGGDAEFPLHQSINGYLEQGDLTVYVRIDDTDYDTSASRIDRIASGQTGPLKIVVSRGAEELVVATAGAVAPKNRIDDNPVTKITNEYVPVELGPINETGSNTGAFELNLAIPYNSGPSSDACPQELRGNPEQDLTRGCILQGDNITVTYADSTDMSGSENVVTASSTFALRDGVLQTDEFVYIIGRDITLTMIEPDFDLDSNAIETYTLDLINWDSATFDSTIGGLGGQIAAFNPRPSALVETGSSTGIFQSVIQMPSRLNSESLGRGEEIELEYTDWGPSYARYVGDEDEDADLTIFTSNFGATIELDKSTYTWTDKVYITIMAPDHNFDSNLVNEIGDGADGDSLYVSTNEGELVDYKLVETGTDTGVFTGSVILTGFSRHDADGDGNTGDASGVTSSNATGPTNGRLGADNVDYISVRFDLSEDHSVVNIAPIRWNIGEVEWFKTSYPATGNRTVQVIDPDMNLNPEEADSFWIDVSSDSDAAGIDLTVSETGKATGIFEGTVYFVVEGFSSGNRLRVSEGDTITAEYEDRTLPDPYNRSDEIEVTGTAIIGNLSLQRPAGSNRDPAAPDIHINTRSPFPSRIVPEITDPDGNNVTIIAVSGGDRGRLDISRLPLIAYTPVQIGTDVITYTVSDGSGGASNGTIYLYTNKMGNARPVLDDIIDTAARAGENLNFTVAAADTDDSSLTFGIANVPDGATINATTGYFSWAPSASQNGSHTVTIFVHDDAGGADWQDVDIYVLPTSNFAIIELDQEVYTWTDKARITVVAPEHNSDSDLVDEIGTGNNDAPLRIATRESKLEDYKLVETGTDTGIFTGSVILTGFRPHDADGNGEADDARGVTSGAGPTDGHLEADGKSAISASFESSENKSIVRSAPIRWNIGEVEWLKASYPATGTGVVRIIDPDMNLNQEAVDNFEIDVSSDSDAAGIDLTVAETGKATGIFEGTVYLVNHASYGHRLAVAEGDTIIAEYEDRTLPDPYNRSDEIEVTGTAIIGSVLPPLPESIEPNRDPGVGGTLIAPVSDIAVNSMLEAYMSRGLVVFTGTLLGSENITYTIPGDITPTVYDPGMVSISAVRPANPNPAPGFIGGLDTTRGQTSAGFLLAGIMIYVPDADNTGAGIVNYAVSDGADPNDTATLAVFVHEMGNVPPVLSPVGNYSINAQETLEFIVSATDFGNGTISYLLSGAPSGATINSPTGYFRWTPGSSDVSNHTFTIIAYDGHGGVDAEPITVRVLPAGTPNRPPIAPNMTVTVDPNGRIIIVPAISDPDGDPVRITDATDRIPADFVFNGADGIIIPSDDSIEYIAITGETVEGMSYTVEDSRGATSIGVITVNIQGAPAPALGAVNTLMQTNRDPYLRPIADKFINAQDTLEFTIVARDRDGDILTYHLANQPAGATMNSASGTFIWTPATSQTGLHAFTVIATDGNGGVDYQTMTVRVLPERVAMYGSIRTAHASPILGDPDAPITIVMFGDYQGHNGKNWLENTRPKISKNYIEAGTVNLVYVDRAFLGRDSVLAAQASHCAEVQGAYWQYHDSLYRNQGQIDDGWASKAQLLQIASDLGLDTNLFRSCLDSERYKNRVLSNVAEGQRKGVSGVPTFFIIALDGTETRIVGAQPYATFEGVLEPLVVKATTPTATGATQSGYKVLIWTNAPVAGEVLEIETEVRDPDGVRVEHLNHDIVVAQGDIIVLDEFGAHHHFGFGSHTTAPLPSNSPVDIKFTLQGLGIGSIEERTGPIGEEIQFRLAPSKDGFRTAPDLVGIAGHINTTPEELEARMEDSVILYDIWTHSDINSVRTLPYITAWNEKYAGDGLLIIGIHSPEFEFEKDPDNVQNAVTKHGIMYPVVLDNDWYTWDAFENRYWPRKYIADHEGYIRYDHIGEGAYEETERVIQGLLTERAAAMDTQTTFTGQLVDIEAFEHTRSRTPELYFGYDFAAGRNRLGNDEGFMYGQNVTYTLPGELRSHHFYMNGTWANLGGSMKLVSESGQIRVPYHAKEVNIVAGNPASLEILLDGQPVPDSHAGADVSNGTVIIGRPGLYNIISAETASSHILNITVSDPGFEIYTFTFG